MHDTSDMGDARTGMRRMAVAAVALVVIACSSQTSPPTGTPVLASAAPTPAAASAAASGAPSAGVAPTTPAGIVAIGHSGLTGEGSGEQLEAVPSNSWATGTNPDVDSVYLRMVAVHPETEGHVANVAHGGAYAAELPRMAAAGLKSITPALVIISTIDNDIRCDGTDADHVAEFGDSVAAALAVIAKASPASKILIVGQLGRPSVDFVKTVIKDDPSAIPALSGTGICDFLDADGKPVVEHFAALTAIIDAYEAEEARVCAEVPNCRTDGGVRATYQDKLENFGTEGHLNARGQAEEAALIWPVVVETLGW